MARSFGAILVGVASVLALPGPAGAQTFEVLGTRAAGMAGAFVAVADDATAVYWNPAGLASGAFFSGVLDWNTSTTEPDEHPHAGSDSSVFVALSLPALGVSYYRLRLTTVRPPDLVAGPSDLTRSPISGGGQVSSLITHHTGVTLVQSLTDALAVATTLKFVRGIATSDLVVAGSREELLDEAGDLIGKASNAFDADIGVMAAFGRVRAGLTVRNATEPDFEAPSGDLLELERQVRAGVAVVPLEGILVAADLDLTRSAGPLGEVRDLAVGAEARVLHAFVRTGFRFNTLGDQPSGRTPAFGIGGSYAVFDWMLVDAQATLGIEAGGNGWGVAARVLF